MIRHSSLICLIIYSGCAADLADEEPILDDDVAAVTRYYAPQGYLDGVTCTQTWGWTCDRDDYSRPLSVHFNVDGPSGSGAFIGSTVANQYRPDVAGACGGTTIHGFALPTSPLLEDGRAHTVYAYAIDPSGAGSNPLLAWAPRTVACAYTPPSAALRYFGFAAAGDYYGETAPFANAVHMGVSYSASYVSKLQAIASAGERSILGLHDVLFCRNGRKTPENRDAWGLCADYAQRWSTFRWTNASVLTATYVLAFYMADEPTWNGITATDLQTATNLVNATFPSIPRMVVESYKKVGQIVIPSTMSWVGFDMYGVRDPATGSFTEPGTNAVYHYRTLYNTLKSRRSSTAQRMIIIADTWWAAGLHGTVQNNIPMHHMDDVATNYYDFARADPDVVGMFGFLWPSFPEGYGARDLPGNVKIAYRLIGRSIAHK